MARKSHKYHYIYKTTCTINGKYYIGMHSTSILEDDYIGSGKRLWLSIRKHGRDNFRKEILEFLPDRNSLREREREIVNTVLINDLMCMNLNLGGDGSWFAANTNSSLQSQKGKRGNEKMKWLRENDEDWKIKIQQKISKNLTLAYQNGRKVVVPDWTGRSHKEETKQRIGEKNSLSQKGEKNSQFGKVWICNNIENKKIDKLQVEDFVKLGWKLGRKMNLG